MSETLALPVLPLDDQWCCRAWWCRWTCRRPRCGLRSRRRRCPPRLPVRQRRHSRTCCSSPAGRQVLRVGTIADIEQVGRLPGGSPPRWCAASTRARIGAGHRPRRGAVGRGHPGRRAPAERSAPMNWPGSTARWPPPSCRTAAPGRSSTRWSGSPTRPSWPTGPATPAYLTMEQRTELLETIDPRAAAGAAGRVGPGPAGRAGRRGDDPQRRPRGHGEAAARVPAPPAAGRDPQGAGRAGRRAGHRGRGLQGPGRGGRPAGEGARGRDEGSRQAGAGQRPVARGQAGSAPGWTRCWRSHGTPVPRTPTTSAAPGPSSTPTTPAWTT